MKQGLVTVAMFLAAMAFCGAAVQAANRFRYPEAAHGNGELRYVNDVPILLVQGSPAEMGEQIGALALKPIDDVKQLSDKFLNEKGLGALASIVLKAGSLMLPQFPRDHLAELDAIAKASGWQRDLLVFGNTFPDIRKMHRCSALIADPNRSATGGPLFGRNLDWGSDIPLHEYTLVTVYRPVGKHSFASIGFPGMICCISGMNDAGLALADLTVNESGDGAPALDVSGVPYGLALRRVLEECATVDEAERLLRSLRRTTMQNVAICDKGRGAVFELTTKQLVSRHAADGVCACTNHFRSTELATNTTCPRYDILDASRQMARLKLTDIVEKMDEVANDSTLQTMIFEPAVLKLHLAFGPAPASQLAMHEVELSTLFTKGEFPTDRGLARGDLRPGPPSITKTEKGCFDVVFRYRPVRRANAVYLAGTFNDWKPTALKMSGPDKAGYYQTSTQLRDGRYEYKFVINGNVWRRDPNNDVQSGSFGNSVIEVGP
jgi:isopenicillin-N N-acyltransferase-like protein